MLQSQDVWNIFNETVRNMNDTANGQYLSTLSEINATQAHSIDPTDMGAYNLTMYGMNSIHDIQSSVIGPMSQLKELSGNAMQGQAAASGMAIGPLNINAGNCIGPPGSLATAVSGMLPAHDILYALLFILIGIAIGAVLFYRR
jgi:hypothetical protein